MDFFEVLKMTFPFIVAICMLWIKHRFDHLQLKRKLEKALSKVIFDEINNLGIVLERLSQINDSSCKRRIRLSAIEVPPALCQILVKLIDVDPKLSYYYAAAISSLETLKIGTERLVGFVNQISFMQEEDISDRMYNVIAGQCKILAIDFISMNENLLKILKKLSSYRYISSDDQDIVAFERMIQSSKEGTGKFGCIED